MEKTVKINENELRQMIAESVSSVVRALNEGGGYDMSTPEGRAGADRWMHYIAGQEDPVETAAEQWASDNAPDYPDISWDTCYECMKRAFIAGVEYGRNHE